MEADDQTNVLPISFVPTPSRAYRIHRKTLKQTVQPGPVAPSAGPVPAPLPLPLPFLRGSRVLMWKQDPSVREIGVRKAFLPNFVTAGPRDARIEVQGLPPVPPNVFGDFIETPGTDTFDSVHTFSV